MENTFVIYDSAGNEIINVPVTRESVRKRVLMADNYVLLVFNDVSFWDFKKGCYVLYGGFRFEIMSDTLPERTGAGWKYSLKFEAQEGHLKKYSMAYREQGVEELVFALTTDLLSFGNVVCACINHEQGGQAWRVKTIPAEFADAVKTLSFKGEKLFDAMTMIANGFECEWWTEENAGFVDICFGKLAYGTEERFETGEVLKSVSMKSGDDANYGTRFYVFGSSRNLTSEYGQAAQGGTTNHVSEIRLRLPDGRRYVDAREDLAQEEVVHQVVFFDDIYPRNTDVVTRVEEVDRSVEGGGTFKAYVVTAAATPFVPSDMIKGETLECVFESGALQGRTFELKINYNPGVWKPSDGFDKKFEIVHTKEGDIILPNPSFKPGIGDRFVITGVKLSFARIAEAEQELLEAGLKLARERSRDTSVCECQSAPVYCRENEKDYDIGQKVCLVDGNRFGTGRASRVQGYEKRLWNPYEAMYTVGDNPQYSRLGAMEGNIKAAEYSERIGVTKGAGIYLIRDRFDNTEPTNYNAYSSLGALRKFATNVLFYEHIDQPVRTTDDVAFHSVKVHKATSEEVGSERFVSGLLGEGYRIKDGHLELDEITVRRRMNVFEVLIQQVRSAGGQLLVTPGSVKIAQVEELEDGYKCYFNTENGTIPNPFFAGDQVIRQVFTGERINRYWRLVTSVGSDYFILGKADCEPGSGFPAVDDEVVQLGNRSNLKRQNAIMICSYGGCAPYIAYYAGINGFSLSGREVMREGNLDGIADADLGQLTGFGLYSQNVFLKGMFKLMSGKTVEQAIADQQSQIDSARSDASDALSTANSVRQSVMQVTEQLTELSAETGQIKLSVTAVSEKADKAKQDAIAAAAADATTKANSVKSEANNYTNSRTEPLWRGWIDASGLNQDKYYPVVIRCSSATRAVIRLEVGLNSGTKPSWASHSAGFSVRCVWSVNGSGWGVISTNRIIDDFTSDHTVIVDDKAIIPVGSIGQMTNGSWEYIYVRGGGKYYFVTTNTDAPELKTSVFTDRGQTIDILDHIVPPEITNATKVELSSQMTLLTGQINAKVSQTIYDEEKQVITDSIAQLQISNASISQTVENVNNRLGTIERSGFITTAEGNTLFARKDNMISSINQTPEAVRINASKIEISGQTIFRDSNNNQVNIFGTGNDVFVINGGKFKVDKYGKMTATDADIVGKIEAKSGKIGNFAINNSLWLEAASSGGKMGISARQLNFNYQDRTVYIGSHPDESMAGQPILGYFNLISGGYSYSKASAVMVMAKGENMIAINSQGALQLDTLGRPSYLKGIPHHTNTGESNSFGTLLVHKTTGRLAWV